MLGVLSQRSLEALALHFLGDQLVLLVQVLADLHFQSVTGSVLLLQCPLVLLRQWLLFLKDMEQLTGTTTLHQPLHMTLGHFLPTVNHSVPPNRFSTPQGQWQHHTIQVPIKLHTVAQERCQVQADIQVTRARQGRLPPEATQTI